MKKTIIFKLLSFALCIVLIAAMALIVAGCNDSTQNSDVSSDTVATAPKQDVVEVGNGSTQFDFTVVDSVGNENKFKVSTDKTIVGQALLDAELISGEEGPYGLYVKTVNGITLDYDADGMYWSFYINGEYAVTGVDATEIESGNSYMFKAEK